MKLLFDFFPIALFFIAYKLYDIYAATMVAISACAIQVAYSWLRHRKVAPMYLVSLVIVSVFGGLTLYLQDELFIKWKPTVINALFAVVFLGSHWVGEKTMIERMIGGNISLPAQIWKRLNLSWVLFFVTISVVNVIVVYNFDTSTWVNFKLFGMLGLTLVFVLLQSVYLARYRINEEAETE
ncbi:septation protein A [Candidatus Methylospira mobilis]|uniref:Inner membrane-spanning protein YciB n=1 Tax=Candidatus Methylospira mobilis TaxID=1808979 RepID=A0A5Q0BMV0_9GAMM|nr:septation protein A [Candidatus Methylospira mobilis]QFY43581.1 septation protein A [Candidatus Methylospira mobilis]WNV03877.1 septation protein A [Candidatus Methylospira mobilis]